MGGACLLFFFTVKNSMQRKLSLHRELLSKLGLDHPEIGRMGQLVDPDELLQRMKGKSSERRVSEKSIETIRQLKINRYQYNTLIKKAPYNWVAKLSNYHAI